MSSVIGEDRCSVSDHADKEQQLCDAIAKLSSLHDGDLGFIDVLAFGPGAIDPLRQLLFKREPSGIYQPRCRAARALGAFRAYDVLRAFLAARRAITDPIERTGEDAVINATAQALGRGHDESDFQLLLDVLRWRILPGVIESIGPFERPEAIPLLIDALGEDDCRLAAEAALRRLGRAPQPALVFCATATPLFPGLERSASRRRRRSALKLLLEMEISPEAWGQVRHLINDPDDKIAALACKLGLMATRTADKEHAMERLVHLLEHADWMIAEDIESFLTEHCEEVAGSIDKILELDNPPMSGRARLVMQRVRARAAPTA